jgi:zinc protease
MKSGLTLAPLCLLTLAASAAFAQTVPQGITKITSVEGITEYKLDNGLKVLVFPDQSKQNITVNMTYLVGSRHEGSGEAGMAHLLEHMVFKGSPKHTNIPQELTEHGARPNGSTTWDRTNYFETFQATEENLRWALDLESDRMVNSFIKREDLDKEFSVVRNEFEMGENSPFNVLFQHTMSSAYLWHAYGRSVIGNKSDIEKVPIDKLQAFYHKFYQPDNVVLTVAGKVDEGHVLALVNDYFGKIPKPTRVLAPTYTVEPPQDGERSTTVRRVGDIQALIAVYHIPDAANADFPALELLASILGEDVSGRLYKALVDGKKATRVFSDAMQMNEPGLMMFGAMLNKTDSLDAARKGMLDTIDGVLKEPPSKEEVDRARTRLLKDIDTSLRDSERIGLFLSEYLAVGDWRLLFLDRDRIRKATPEDVARVAKEYLKVSNRTIGEFIPDAKPERAEVASKSDVEAMLKGYKGDAAIENGEAFDPSPKNIEARTSRFILPSGMKVSFLPKKTRGGSVHATIALHFGDVENLKGKDVLGSLVASTLIKGTANKNRQQIQDEIDRLKAQLRVFGGPTGANVSLETVKDNLPAVLQLAGEILKEPTIPDTEFDQEKKQQITQAEAGKSEPQVQAFVRLQRVTYPFPRGDVRSAMNTEEEIEDLTKATVEQARAFHKEFYGASHAELSVVGDFDPAAAKKTITDLFGAWQSPAKYEPVKNGYVKIAAVNEKIETPDKKNAVFAALQRMKINDKNPDYPGLVFGNYMLGGGFLNSRLAQRIRVKDGLSYGVGSNFGAKADDEDGRFQVFAIAAPQNVEKVEAAFKDEVAKMLKEGFTDKEVEADKSGWLQSRQVGRAEDQALCGMLAARDHDGRNLDWDEELEAKVRALTPAEVTEAMRRHIDLAEVTIVKAGDFQKPAASGSK